MIERSSNKTHEWIHEVVYYEAGDIMYTHRCKVCNVVKSKTRCKYWRWSYINDKEWRGPINIKHINDFNYHNCVKLPKCSEVLMEEALG